MTQKTITKKLITIIVILIVLIFAMTIIALSVDRCASASSSADYTVSQWYMKEPDKVNFNAEEGCTYIIYLVETDNAPIIKAYYSAYQISIEQEKIVDNDEIIVPFVEDAEGNELDMVEISNIERNEWNSRGERAIMFEVTAHEWTAFKFFIEWQDSSGESQMEDSDFFYCTNIDNSPPFLALTDEPIYQDSGFWFQFHARANGYTSYRSSNSGFKKITIYRRYDTDKIILKTYTEFKDKLNFYGDFLADKKGEYFIEAIDGVGNKTTKKVIEIIYDITDGIIMDNAEAILANKKTYSQALIDELNKAYMNWQLMSISASEEEILQARTQAQQVVIKCLDAQQEFAIKIINDFYFDYVTVENFNIDSYSDVVKGEKVTLNIALAQLQANKTHFNDLLLEADLPSADTIYAFHLNITSDIKGDKLSDFNSPLKITVPITKYTDIVAVSESIVNGKKVYQKLRLDKGKDWVMVYAPHVEVINIVIVEKNKSNLTYLYFLFLLIPIAGIFVYIFRNKIFKKKATQTPQAQTTTTPTTVVTDKTKKKVNTKPQKK